MRFTKVVLIVVAAGIGAWIARLLAHSKVPLPEGSWREISIEDLARKP